MSNHSSAQSLAATLAQKQEQDRQQIEALTKSALEQLASNLRQQSSDALGTTLSAIESELNERLNAIRQQIAQQSSALNATLNSLRCEDRSVQTLALGRWLLPLTIHLILLLCICAGSWGLMRYLSDSILERIATKTALEQDILTQQDTLRKLDAKTWGVELHQDKEGKFLILPAEAETGSGWRVGKRYAVRLGKH